LNQALIVIDNSINSIKTINLKVTLIHYPRTECCSTVIFLDESSKTSSCWLDYFLVPCDRL